MHSLYHVPFLESQIQRIYQLSPNNVALWGKMNVAQMLAHCSAGLQEAIEQKNKKQMFIGKVIGGWMKRKLLQEGYRFGKGTPTSKEFIILHQPIFEEEQEKLISLLKLFSLMGQTGKLKEGRHAFYGKMSPLHWDRLMCVHLNHHLNQFGV